MSARFLAWYACVTLALATLLVSAASVVPGYEWVQLLLMLVTGAGAVGFAIIGSKLGRLPQDHWGNRSRTVRAVLVVVAMVATMLMVG
jgi:hypothetical protein